MTMTYNKVIVKFMERMVMVDVTLKNKKLFFLDPTNLSLRKHTNWVNKLLESGNFSSNYKSYENEKEDNITFICFDIESIITKSGFVLQNFKYQGNLKFAYNKITHKILIHKLPEYKGIAIFTSDILSIIMEKLKNYTELDKLVLTFEDTYQKFAIDNNLKKLFPHIEQDSNYKRMCLIFERMFLEEEQIKKEVLAKKRRKNKEDATKERIIAKKSIIHGVDQRNYKNDSDYLKAVNKRIVEVCEYKINNIKRHIKANKKIYIALLEKNDKTHKTLKKILESIYEGFSYNIYCEEEIYRTIESSLEDTSKKTEITEELLNIYYDASFEYDSDLNNEKSLVSLLTHVRIKRDWNEARYDEDGKYPARPNDMYNFILGVKDYYGTECEDIINYKNPIFQGYRIVQKDFKKCVDVLFQVASLKKQLSYYENIKSNPHTSLLNFQSNSNSWNSILNFPYWLRLGRDTSKKDTDENKETFNLLMIKPGVKDIDLDSIRIFTRKNGHEFGSTKIERQEYLTKLTQGKIEYWLCDRLMITIPKSLNFESIIKIIDYAHNYGTQIQFICETLDVASLIKEILVDRAISAYKQVSIVEEGYEFCTEYKKVRKKYFKNRCFLCVDPEYFKNFMLDTPTNKNFWHRYDYTGNYKFRKTEPASLDYVIDRTIYENTHDGVIDYERINKQLLGSYSSDETKVEPVNIRFIDFIDIEDYYRLPEWFPECRGLDYYALETYLENNFSDRFYLDKKMRSKLYECNYDEEKDHQNEGEIYTKKLKIKSVCDENGLPFNE